MDKVILKQILTEYNQKRIYEEERIQKEKKALEDANPKLKELNDKIAKVSLDYSKKILTSKKEDQFLRFVIKRGTICRSFLSLSSFIWFCCFCIKKWDLFFMNCFVLQLTSFRCHLYRHWI